jgi:hypothetical protein
MIDKKKITYVAVVLFLSAVSVGLASWQNAAAAGTKCWQVDCNTCCRGAGGVICTQRACP